jgi:excisionase family DNA binding protein
MAWTVRDARRLLSVSHATIYNLVKSGRLRMVHVGRRALVPDEEIRRLVAEGTR